jgi:predicted helicase
MTTLSLLDLVNTLFKKNGEGILAYISNNSFLDGVTHRQMRKNLLETFDKIFILDLHVNSKRKEIDPDGGKDENVFDIMQGVSINLFIKTNGKIKGKLADVKHIDLYGLRQNKYNFLLNNRLKQIEWKTLECIAPYYFFINKNFYGQIDYNSFFSFKELFLDSNNGIESRKDSVTIHFTDVELQKVKSDFEELSVKELIQKYHLEKESRDWKVEWVKSDLKLNSPLFTSITYRPFDIRKTLYSGKTKGFSAILYIE